MCLIYKLNSVIGVYIQEKTLYMLGLELPMVSGTPWGTWNVSSVDKGRYCILKDLVPLSFDLCSFWWDIYYNSYLLFPLHIFFSLWRLSEFSFFVSSQQVDYDMSKYDFFLFSFILLPYSLSFFFPSSHLLLFFLFFLSSPFCIFLLSGLWTWYLCFVMIWLLCQILSYYFFQIFLILCFLSSMESPVTHLLDHWYCFVAPVFFVPFNFLLFFPVPQFE